MGWSIWLVVTGTMEFWMTFHEQLGISSSQLTFTPSFFRGVGQPPTSLDSNFSWWTCIWSIWMCWMYWGMCNGRFFWPRPLVVEATEFGEWWWSHKFWHQHHQQSEQLTNWTFMELPTINGSTTFCPRTKYSENSTEAGCSGSRANYGEQREQFYV